MLRHIKGLRLALVNSGKYKMKGFIPTAESHGLARGTPPASRIMTGVPFSRSIQRLMKAGMEVLKQIMNCGQARHKDGGQAC